MTHYLDTAMHALGIAALAGGAGLSALIFRDALRQHARIVAALRRHPVPPASSAAPHAASRPRSRVVEAGARSTVEATRG